MSCPSSIRRRDSNPRPLQRESPPITTRPELPPLHSFFDKSCITAAPWYHELGMALPSTSLTFHVGLVYLRPTYTFSNNIGDAAKAQWIHPCLPSCRPGFESQAHHLHLHQFIELYNVKKTKINKKRPELCTVGKTLLFGYQLFVVQTFVPCQMFRTSKSK